MTKFRQRLLLSIFAIVVSFTILASIFLITNRDKFALAESNEASPIADGEMLDWYYNGNRLTANEYELEYNHEYQQNFVTAKYGTTTYSVASGNLKIYNESNTEVSSVIDAGVYTFTVEDNGIVFANGNFTFTVLKYQLNLGNENNLVWRRTDSTSLNSGTVYTYTYSTTEEPNITNTYFTMTQHDSAPDRSWQNWRIGTPYTATNSILPYKTGSVQSIQIQNLMLWGDTSSDNRTYTIEYDDGTGTRSATDPGMYTAKAVLTPGKNYVFTYDTQDQTQTALLRGMVIGINSDGTATITKTWFIAHVENNILQEDVAEESKVAYGIPSSWVFGMMPEGGVPLPRLEFGDELRGIVANEDILANFNGYMLQVGGNTVVTANVTGVEWEDRAYETGTKDIVTFTLVKDGKTICSDLPRSRWEYYVNEYMPAGQYMVLFTVQDVIVSGTAADWWSGGVTSYGSGGLEYRGFTQAYEFEVTPGNISIMDSAFNAYGQENPKRFRVNIADLSSNFDKFFSVIGTVEYSAYIDVDVVNGSETYWATVAEEYFGTAPELTFNLARMYNPNIYMTVDDEGWARYINEPGLYTVFYRATMKNYSVYPDSEESPNKYFYVDVYRALQTPQLVFDEYAYTGAAIAFTSTFSSYYTLSGNVQTEVGDYFARFTLTDPVHYIWADEAFAELDYCEVPYKVTPAINGWASDLYIVTWSWGGFDRMVNTIKAVPYVGEVTLYLTTDEEGEKVCEGLEDFYVTSEGIVTQDVADILQGLDVGTYYLWAAVLDGGKNFSPIEPESYRFEVVRAQNYWETTPNVARWIAGIEQPNLPTGVAHFGEVIFQIISEDGNKVYYDSSTGVNNLSDAQAGWYILKSTVEADNNQTGLSQEMKFRVFSSGNAASGDETPGSSSGGGNSSTDHTGAILMIFFAVLIVAVAAADIVFVLKYIKENKRS